MSVVADAKPDHYVEFYMWDGVARMGCLGVVQQHVGGVLCMTVWADT